MKKIQLIVGSVDGTADFSATTLATELIAEKHQVSTPDKPNLKSIVKSQDELFLFITSTTGKGELPKNLQPLWRKLYTKNPQLKNINYATAVLGDSSYGDDYCLGGIKLDKILEKLGAKKLAPPLLIDAEKTNNPEEDITTWGKKLVAENLDETCSFPKKHFTLKTN